MKNHYSKISIYSRLSKIRCVTSNNWINYCRYTLQQRRDASIDDRDNSVNHDGDDGAAAATSSANVSADAHSAQKQQ